MRTLRTVLGVLAALGGLGVLSVSVLAQGGRVSGTLDILTHFAPIYLALGVFALAGAALAPPGWLRRTAAVISLGAVAASGALVAPEFLAPPPPTVDPAQVDPADTIKIIQFNALSRNRKADEAARWVMAQKPDIVVLQEGSIRNQLMKEGHYVGTCLYCGAGILTRQKPTAKLQTPWRTRAFAYVTTATLHDAHGPFTVIGVRRPWPTDPRRNEAQMRDLAALVPYYDRHRIIMAGDFNSTPWSFARQREDRQLGLIRRTRALATWPAERVSDNRLPAPFPYLPIDHVYAGPGWATVKVERGPRLGSDHYPVVVTLAPIKSGGR